MVAGYRVHCGSIESVEVIFERTGERRYAIEVRRTVGGSLRMDPAPGFDDYFPHDLQHLIVEEQLGLTGGIFGRLAKGGTASTFAPVRDAELRNTRQVARRRRTLLKRDRRLADVEPPDFAESERATYVAWHDWLGHCPEPEMRRRGAVMTATAVAIVERSDPSERARIETALPRLRARINDVARRWNALSVGEQLTIAWNPLRRQRTELRGGADPKPTDAGRRGPTGRRGDHVGRRSSG